MSTYKRNPQEKPAQCKSRELTRLDSEESAAADPDQLTFATREYLMLQQKSPLPGFMTCQGTQAG